MDDHPVPGTAIVRCDLLGPGEGGVSCNSPSGSKVGVRHGTAELVVMFQDLLDGFRHRVEVGHFVEETAHAAFSTRAVVAENVEDQRVIELAHVCDGVDEPADLGVRVLGEACEYLHLAGEEFLLVRGQLVPVLDRCGLRCKLRTRRHHAQLDLAGKRLLPQLVPPLVELALVLGDPFPWARGAARVSRPARSR